MKTVSLILGNSSLSIEKSLKETLDDVSFQVFKDVDSLIRTSSQKENADRIIISSAGIRKGNSLEDLKRLSEFVTQVSVRTSVVFILKKGSNKEDSKFFHEHFNSPLYTDMVIEKVSLYELGLSVTEEIEFLRKKYSAYQINEIEVLEDSIDNTMDNSRDNFIVERPMLSLPKIKTRTFSQKMFSKDLEYTSKEKEDLNFNLEIIKLHMNLINNAGYKKYIDMIDNKDKKEFYTKNHLIRIPKVITDTVVATKEKLSKEDFIIGLQSLIDFNKEPNLSASKFVNKTGKPVSLF